MILHDEVTSDLDKNTAEIIENYLLDLASMVIMVMHHLTDNINEKVDEIINLSN